jgi:selenoprotein W-related protein
LTHELLKAFETSIRSLELIPSSGGVFEVDVNGARIYSKKAAGRHADPGEIANLIQGIISPAATE